MEEDNKFKTIILNEFNKYGKVCSLIRYNMYYFGIAFECDDSHLIQFIKEKTQPNENVFIWEENSLTLEIDNENSNMMSCINFVMIENSIKSKHKERWFTEKSFVLEFSLSIDEECENDPIKLHKQFIIIVRLLTHALFNKKIKTDRKQIPVDWRSSPFKEEVIENFKKMENQWKKVENSSFY